MSKWDDDTGVDAKIEDQSPKMPNNAIFQPRIRVDKEVGRIQEGHLQSDQVLASSSQKVQNLDPPPRMKPKTRHRDSTQDREQTFKEKVAIF